MSAQQVNYLKEQYEELDIPLILERLEKYHGNEMRDKNID